MRQYAMRDFYPENCPERVFNTWRGYAVENIDPALGAKGSSDKFVELVTVLTDGQPKYALDYYALLFQQPGTKPRTCLVYRGKPGCGKGVHLTSLEILMGSVDTFFCAQRLQLREVPTPRRCSTQAILVPQTTSSTQTLERSQVSAESSILFIFDLLNLPPRRVHRVTHPAAHPAKHREVRGVGHVFFHERDGDIEGKARERDARLRVEVPLALARARLDAARRLGDHRVLCRVLRACRSACPARVVVRVEICPCNFRVIRWDNGHCRRCHKK